MMPVYIAEVVPALLMEYDPFPACFSFRAFCRAEFIRMDIYASAYAYTQTHLGSEAWTFCEQGHTSLGFESEGQRSRVSCYEVAHYVNAKLGVAVM